MKPKQTVGATEFKARCLALLEQVAQDRVALVVTKHGRPIAKLVPYEEEAVGQAFGLLAGTVKTADDLTAPTGEVWEADA